MFPHIHLITHHRVPIHLRGMLKIITTKIACEFVTVFIYVNLLPNPNSCKNRLNSVHIKLVIGQLVINKQLFS